MPEGIRCSFHSSPSRTIVWPALLPPWKRTTASPCSASRSVTLPFPSSPHWAPTITIPGMQPAVYEGRGGRPYAAVAWIGAAEADPRGDLARHPNDVRSDRTRLKPPVMSQQRQLVAHLGQTRHGP